MINGYDKILLIPEVNGTHCIPLETIIRIEASSNYCKVFCNDKPYPIVVAKLLRWFEEKLPKDFFTRVHRTHLVNKRYMVSIGDKGILMQSGMLVALSRRKKKQVLNSFISNTGYFAPE